jgi:diguanylate cyclase (GGDEF)-like protein/PAS domain S-box-containing protein
MSTPTLPEIGTHGLAHSILNSLVEGVVVHAPDGSIVWCNDTALEVLGLTVDQLLGRQPVDPRWRAVHGNGSPWPGDTHPVMVTIATRRAVPNVVMGVHRPDNSMVWLQVSSSPLDEDTEVPGGAVATFVDVTERHSLLRQLETARDELQNLFAMSPTGMALMSAELDVVRANAAFTDMVGWSEADLIVGGLKLVIHPDDLATATDMGEQLLSGQLGAYRAERRLVHRDGQILHVIIAPVIVSAIGDVPWRIFSQVVDVTESHHHEQQLQFLAEHDALTGLLNRRGFARQLHGHLESGASGGAVLIVDLDHFKQVNDRGGHEAGDRLLVAITRTMRDRLHPTTEVARLGGDEFGVLVRAVEGAVPTSEAQAVVDAVIEICADFEGHHHDVTASVGVAPLSGPSTASAVLKRADDALYIAKREGRSRWACLEA